MFKLLFILFRAFVTPDDEQIKITYDVCVCVCRVGYWETIAHRTANKPSCIFVTSFALANLRALET